MTIQSKGLRVHKGNIQRDKRFKECFWMNKPDPIWENEDKTLKILYCKDADNFYAEYHEDYKFKESIFYFIQGFTIGYKTKEKNK